jgi:hypothetical protein
VKRKRGNEEVDVLYDLSEAYPPLTPPPGVKLDAAKIQGLLVAATSAARELRPITTDENADPKLVQVAKLSLAVFDAVEAVIECGIMPLSGAAARRSGNGLGTETGGNKAPPVPPPKPAAPAGMKELREGLDKADRETILFDADLGKVTLANRKALANAFSSGIRSAAVAGARAANEDPAEAVRVLDNALSVVQDMDFNGASSKHFRGKTDADMRNGSFCTMPIKFRFEDKDARIHFETTIRKHCTLRASMSLPWQIRKEQAAFQRAVKDRYPDEVVTVRVDTLSMCLQAFRKADGEKKWTKCPEMAPLLPGVLLPGYNPRSAFDLPPAVQVVEPGTDQVGGGGGGGPMEEENPHY